MSERFTIGKIDFTPVTFRGAVQSVVESAMQGGARPIRLANAWCVVLADQDERYAAVTRSVGTTFADGFPIAALMRRRHPLAQRVRGPSLFGEVFAASRAVPIRHYLIGSTPDGIEKLSDKLLREHPGSVISGSWSPPFAPINETTIEIAASKVVGSGANLVWIGIGSPKQDLLAAELAERTRTTCVGVGAAFDFALGTARESPKWLSNIGFEWLFRLATNPRRLAGRYLIGNAKFVAIVLRDRFAVRSSR